MPPRSVLDDLGEEITGIVAPVSVCMALVVLLVKVLNPDGQSGGATVSIATIAYQEQDDDTAGRKLGGALLNAIVFVAVIAAMTFLLFLLFKWGCYRVIYGYMAVAMFQVFFVITGGLALELLHAAGIHMDLISLCLLLFNLSVVGILSLFFLPVPLLLKQAVTVWTGVAVAYVFTHVPQWTTWVLLGAMALYDLAAVLLPGGPLKILVELAVERNQELPALIYESRPVGRPYRRGEWRPQQQQQQQQQQAAGNGSSSGAAGNGSGGDASSSGASGGPGAVLTAAIGGVLGGRSNGSSGSGDASPTQRLALLAGHRRSSADGMAVAAGLGMGAAPAGGGGGGSSSSSSALSQELSLSSSSPGGPAAAGSAGCRAVRRSGSGSGRDHGAAAGAAASLAHDAEAAVRSAGGGGTAVSDRLRGVSDAVSDDGSLGLPDGIKLGLGDFIFYSMLVGRAAMYDMMTVYASYLAIIAGLGATLLLLALAQKALPALPISIALGVAFYFLTRLVVEPLVVPLALHLAFF